MSDAGRRHTRVFDVVVIGAGPAGRTAAGRLAEGGRNVVIVERELVGGECSFWACMPAKALLRPQELLAEVARVPGAAEAVGEREVDVAATLTRRDEVINHLDDAHHVPWLESHGVTLVRGSARLQGERRVIVGDEALEAREAVIVAVGTTATIPPIPGLAEAAPWTSREVTTTSEIPNHLIILGGGVVGVEMAQAWRSLGSRVSVIEALDSLLAREEPFAGKEVAAALAQRGIDVRTGVRATRITASDDDTIRVDLGDGSCVSGDRLLVAIGRTAVTDDLGLEKIGLEPGGSLDVDDTLHVAGHRWLYAVGDVNGLSLLTHVGKYQARVAADHILGDEQARIEIDGPLSPRVVFTDPQVAATGHTLSSALEAGIPAKAIDLPTAGTAGASFHGRNTPGTTRFIVDTERDVLVGVTFVGPDVAEFLHAATIAIVGQVPLSRLVHAIPPFPARSELWLQFIEAYGR
ncbi:MAG: NAD(P)/FAD-dependent oxidoreductase [Actinomycetota bacterium]|nr:NAD(P)/FAD-dependent oxidoreductase [Actinomycetota bacterium]